IVFAWIFKCENVIPKLNKNSKSIKLGKWWIFIVKYLLPIVVAIVWVGGLFDTIKTGTFEELIVFVILTVILIGLTLMFTVLPSKNENWYKTKSRFSD
ncbi:MAG: sodium-dependent transporter, partial [Methanobrevibacter wolinii]